MDTRIQYDMTSSSAPVAPAAWMLSRTGSADIRGAAGAFAAGVTLTVAVP
ncbi:hypothetical protein OG709_14630 [Streptomyces sp. NBC_01267]|nr:MULTISPECIES: hypothetical protein [unclassified Streptomyces]MCX4550319.1 hypothetical protein [Streptomyces sp. NBC_01500]